MKKTVEATQKIVQNIVFERSAVFAFFWAFAHFVDEFRQPVRLVSDPFAGFLHMVVFALSVSIFFKPSSTGRLFTMSLVSVAVTVAQMPITPNHNIILLFGDLAIVTGIFVYSFRKNADLKNWFYDSEPFLRIALLITYGSATIAKLNSGWFNTELSCSTTMPAREFSWFPIDIPWETFWFMPFVIGGAELLIWLLPLFPKIRPYALVLATSFHIALSLTPDSQGLGFSFILFALLVLYLPDNSHAELYRRGKAILQGIKDRRMLGFTVYGFIILSALMGFISFVDVGNEIFRWVRYAPMLILIIIFGLIIQTQAIKHRNAPQVRPAVAVRHWTQLILVTVVILNSLGPYLGYKTYATMTMYSNLSTHSESYNHLVIPKIPLSNMSEDLVTIIESSNPKLQSYAQRGLRIVWHELRREMAKDPSQSVTFIRNSEVFEYENAFQNEQLRTLDPILHKLLGFRPIGEETICLW